MVETRKRYRNSKEYVTPKVAEKSARLGGNMEESEFDEVEVVEFEGKRVYKDQLDSFKEVHAEMAEASEEDEDE